METRDFILLAYDAFGGQIRGKTTLQKRLYFLGVFTGQDLGFGPHYYGPYSQQIANANNELKSLGYLEESVAGWGAVSPRGFEIARYDYRLSEDGRLLTERKKQEFPEEWESIRRTAEKIKGAGDIDYMLLAVAAKAYFILQRQGSSADFETIRTVARKFGWSVGENDLNKAVDFLEKLDLVRRS